MNIWKSIKDLVESLARARAAAYFTRQGRHEEARRVMMEP